MRIRSGDSFESLAGEFSMDGGTSAQGGDLGTRTKSALPDAVGDVVFSMQEGDLEGPVRSDFGFHIVRLDDILEQGPLALDQVRGELLSELREREAESLFLDLERKLSDALFDLTDMQAIATAVGVDVATIPGFTRSGGEPFGAASSRDDDGDEDGGQDGDDAHDDEELDQREAGGVAAGGSCVGKGPMVGHEMGPFGAARPRRLTPVEPRGGAVRSPLVL